MEGSICLLKSKLFSDMSNMNCYLFGRGYQITQFKESYSNVHLDTSSMSEMPSIPEKSILENVYLLLPAVFGIGIAYLISLKPEFVQSAYNDSSKSTEQRIVKDFPKEDSNSAEKLITLIYVFVSVIGIAMFIYRSVMGVDTKNPLQRLLPIGIGLGSAIFLFSSVNLALFVIFPTSFKGNIQERWIDKAIDFFYYSTLGLTTGAEGDITPTESTTRLLLVMEGMVNLIIFSLLISSLFS